MITHRDIAMPTFDEFLMQLKMQDTSNWKVLEIGPGQSREFKTKFERLGIKWTGLDFIQFQDVTLGNMENMPFDDKSFDIIFSCHSFEHTVNPIQTLKEMKRVCKKKIFLITPFHCQHQILEGDPTHRFVFTDIQMRRLLIDVGIYPRRIYIQKNAEKEQDWNLITMGELI